MTRSKRKGSKVSLGDIATAAGISKAAVGYALQNRPGVSKATRERVLQIAGQLGYVPDARMASWMARVRSTEQKQPVPIAWLNTHGDRDAWTKHRFLSPYFEGATARALQLGYRLEEIWLLQPGMTTRRVSQILYQQGVEGVIVTQYAKHLGLKWDYLAGVGLEHTQFMPRIHCVSSDVLFNFLLAMKMLKRFGYRRIGICLLESIDRDTSHSIRALIPYLDARIPKLEPVPPFFYAGEPVSQWETIRSQIIAWLRLHKPEVIVVHDSRLVSCVEDAGYDVPNEVGVVHLAVDDDVSDWAGIHSKRRESGAAAVETVVSLMHQRQFGMPKTTYNIIIRGSWSPGRSLLIPKPKEQPS